MSLEMDFGLLDLLEYYACNLYWYLYPILHNLEAGRIYVKREIEGFIYLATDHIDITKNIANKDWFSVELSFRDKDIEIIYQSPKSDKELSSTIFMGKW